MKKIIVYGTGASAEMYLNEMPKDNEILYFCETNPSKTSFKGYEVKKFSKEIKKNYDYIVIASMFYPEILESLIHSGVLISKIKIATSHKDDPRFGVLMINPEEVQENIQKYQSFKKEIIKIEELVNSANPRLFSDRFDHLKYSFEMSNVDGNNLEFGVYHGESLLYLSNLSKKPVWGFDSFCGTLEDSPWDLRGNKSEPKMICKALQDYKYLEVGYFHETLPAWIENHKGEPISFMHYDAGDYEASCFVMNLVCPMLEKGSVIVFDEFIPSPTELIASEYEAFVKYCKHDFEIISRSGSSVTLVIK